MAILLDTGIVLHIVRKATVRAIVNPASEDEYISVVTVGEIRSIGYRNGWGNRKLDQLEELLSQLIILDINNETLIDRYVQIDAFSQGKHKSINSPFTAINMGKNDLWIAATASFLEVPLYTVDGDFDHLHDVFFKVVKYSPERFRY